MKKRLADKDAADKFVDEFAKLVCDDNSSPDKVCNADETELLEMYAKVSGLGREPTSNSMALQRGVGVWCGFP